MKSTATILAALAASTLLAGTAVTRGAGLLIADGGLGGQLQIDDQDVHVTINNGIAVTTVTQTFENLESRQVEALYSFPVPKAASVSNFSMWINGKEMVGEVLEKKHARDIYNSYKQVRRDPGLLEQKDFRTFEMRVFPIAAKAKQKVQITYYQELEFDHDWATYVYPLATSTRPIAATNAGKFKLNVDAKSEIPITEISSPSHPKQTAMSKANEHYAQASLELSDASLNKDVVIAYHTQRPHTGLDIVTSKHGTEDGYFFLTLTAGEELATQNQGGADYIFVQDISGSMNDDNKLNTSEKSLAAFIRGLSKDDRFEVLTFNNAPHPLFSKLVPATADNQKQATDFLDTASALGGTELAPALTAAYHYDDPDRPLNVVILSDGLTEPGDTQTLVDLISRRPNNAKVFCVGVGNDVNRPLLEQIADKSGGLAAFLSRDDDLQRQAAAFRRKLTRPIATNLNFTINGASTYDLSPTTLPNLYYGAPVRLFGRYKLDGNNAPTTAHIAATINGKSLAQDVPITLPPSDETNPQIERMWAFHKIDDLMKQSSAEGTRDAAIPEIVRLGQAYSIVSEYTSFLVLENDSEFQRWHIDRTNLLRLDRERQQTAALDSSLSAMRLAAAQTLGPASPPSLQSAALPQPITAPPTAMNTPTITTIDPHTPPPAPRDISFTPMSPPPSGGGGGGAIDPLLGTVMLSLAATLLLAPLALKPRHQS